MMKFRLVRSHHRARTLGAQVWALSPSTGPLVRRLSKALRMTSQGPTISAGCMKDVRRVRRSQRFQMVSRDSAILRLERLTQTATWAKPASGCPSPPQIGVVQPREQVCQGMAGLVGIFRDGPENYHRSTSGESPVPEFMRRTKKTCRSGVGGNILL